MTLTIVAFGLECQTLSMEKYPLRNLATAEDLTPKWNQAAPTPFLLPLLGLPPTYQVWPNCQGQPRLSGGIRDYTLIQA